MSSFHKIMKTLSLSPVKTVIYNFDPYLPTVRSIREVLEILNSPKLLDSNPECKMKYNIKSDHSAPVLDVTFKDDHRVVFNTENLTTLEILNKFSDFCVERMPKQETVLRIKPRWKFKCPSEDKMKPVI